MTTRGRAARVLVALPGAELYGSDRMAAETVAGLLAAGCEVTVTAPAPGPLLPRLAELGAAVQVCAVPVLRKSVLRPAGALAFVVALGRSLPGVVRLLRGTGAEVVVVNTVTVPLWLLAGRLAGRRVVCHVHEAETGAPRWVRRLLAAPLLLTHWIVVNSRFSQDVLAGAWPRLTARSSLVPNAVPGPPTPPIPARRDGPLHLLYVGRISARKGVDVAVTAVAALVAGGADVRFDVVGSVFAGQEAFELALHDQVRTTLPEGVVRFHGFESDVRPRLAGADVVLVPSVLDEPFGNTAVEAVLAARPAVVSDQGGLREAVDGYASVVTVTPADAGALAAAVTRIGADFDAFAAAAVADADRARQRHDPAHYRRRMVELVLGPPA